LEQQIMVPSQAAPGARAPRAVVICGTDFSERAGHAADVAADLSRAIGLPLLLVHAVQASVRGGAGRNHPALAALRREASRLRARGATVTEVLQPGRPDEVLVDLARQRHARLVVVASLGSRSGRWRLGSVSDRTTQTSVAPTLVVRAAAPFEAWLRGGRPLKVFVAYDFTVTAEAGLEWVRTLLDIAPCHVTLGYTNRPSEALDRFGYETEANPAEDNLPAVQELLERDLRDRVALHLGGIEARLRVRPVWGGVAETIMRMAADEGADVIVTGTHQVRGVVRAWQASVSRALLYHAPENVICVPQSASTRRIPRVPAIRRVLVSTDLSPVGNRAVAHALAITRPGGTVRLLHVVHPRAIGRGRFEQRLGSSERHARHVRALGRELQGLLPPDAASLEVSADAQVIECEDPATGICRAAEQFGADVIVIGSNGLSGLSRMVVGSVAQAVMQRSRRPVFTVRTPAE
jgi:nucleotide-binding universal stress UspA family protein